MSKTKKPTPLPVTPAAIEKASETNAIKALVELADAYSRISLHGPYPTSMPSFVSVFVGGGKNAYRKMNLGIGQLLMPERITLGKKSGLIFVFKPAGNPIMRDGNPVERIELNWDDVINYFEDLADRVEERMNRHREVPVFVANIDKQIKDVIAANPSMHKILTDGFALAQSKAREEAHDESLSEIPGYGMF